MATAQQSSKSEPQKAQVVTEEQAPVEVIDDDEGQISTLSGVFGSQEIVVGEPENVIPQQMQYQDPGVIIRVGENIDAMSIVSGGQRVEYTFEAGHQYRVPTPVAEELDRIGRLWH